MRYIIIGNSAAAVSAVEAIRSVDNISLITVISREKYTAYSPILTTYLISGQVTSENMVYRSLKWYEGHQVELILCTEITKVETESKKVTSRDGESWHYDKLLIATGASPIIPCIPGAQADGVFGVRTFQDVLGIKNSLVYAKKAVVTGGGLVSCKAAEALIKAGAKVEMVISSKQLLSRLLTENQASFVQREAERNGVIVRTNDDIASVEDGGKGKLVRLVSGQKVSCDIIIAGKGVRPNLNIIDRDKVKVDKGILVDEHMETSCKDIYAAGDVAQTRSLLNGLQELSTIWPEAIEQGNIAGLNMAGKSEKYIGSLNRNTLSFFDIKLASIGVNSPVNDRQEVFCFKKGKRAYYEFIMEGNFLVGTFIAGDIKDAGIYASIIKRRIAINNLDRLLSPSLIVNMVG